MKTIQKSKQYINPSLTTYTHSDVVYPVKDCFSLEETNEEFQTGKYEPLANMNGLLRQEIKRVIYNIAS